MTGDQVRAAARNVRELRWWRFPWSARVAFSVVLDEAAATIDRQTAEIFRLRGEVSAESTRRHVAEIALDEIVANEREAELERKADAIRRELAMREPNVVRLQPRQRVGRAS